jgi:hypothetical protein
VGKDNVSEVSASQKEKSNVFLEEGDTKSLIMLHSEANSNQLALPIALVLPYRWLYASKSIQARQCK